MTEKMREESERWDPLEQNCLMTNFLRGRYPGTDRRVWLQRALTDPDPDVRVTGLSVVSDCFDYLGKPKEIVFGALRDPEPVVRATALDVVVRHPDIHENPFNLAVEYARDSVKEVQASAANLCFYCVVRSEAPERMIGELLDSPAWESDMFHWSAVMMLYARVKSIPNRDELLVKLFADQDPLLRQRLFWVFYRKFPYFDPKKRSAFLVDALENDDPGIRFFAREVYEEYMSIPR